MYNIVLFGVGKGSLIVESSLNENCNIICYCDNDQSRWDEIHNKRRIVNPKKIKEISFDFIIIASQFNEEIYTQLKSYNIPDEKILQFYVYIDYARNYVKIKLNDLYNFREEYNIISTGLSYMNYALNNEVLKKKLINFANPSQDIYYDYHVIKYIIDNYKIYMKNLEYVIIGLGYYSFEYDMSLSAMRGKVPFYYEAIGVKHNFNDVESFLEVIKTNKNIAKKVLKLESDGYPQINWINDVQSKIVINEEIGNRQALLDCNKNHPKTVKENIEILNEYLELLKNNNIKAIIVVPPTSKYYYNNFLKRIKKEFLAIIEQMKLKYDFQFIDYFDSELFRDDEFCDVSHLNYKGSIKFTKLINNLI